MIGRILRLMMLLYFLRDSWGLIKGGDMISYFIVNFWEGLGVKFTICTFIRELFFFID